MTGPSRPTLIALAFLGVINLVRGTIHAFLPDGGAGVIAGLDLSQSRETILFLFAGIGISQIAAGVVDLAVVLRWRAFAVPLLVIEALRGVLFTAVTQLWKPPPVEVPGERFIMIITAVLVLALIWELARRLRRAPH
jgi:hypothetical protein